MKVVQLRLSYNHGDAAPLPLGHPPEAVGVVQGPPVRGPLIHVPEQSHGICIM